jgi:hypothetical protein
LIGWFGGVMNNEGVNGVPAGSVSGGPARAAPVALFVYNRPSHARQTVEALKRNEFAPDTDLFVFSDGPKSRKDAAAVLDARAVVRSIVGFRSVSLVEREANLGLAQSIIDGVTAVCSKYGHVIVLEDDLVTAPTFLRFMNDALRMYEYNEKVGSIHGYWYPTVATMPDTFFLRGASCWGWATWSRAWSLFEPDGHKLLLELRRRDLTGLFDLDGAMAYTRMLRDQVRGRNDSWAIRWHASMFIADRLQLSPGRSLVRNIGFDGSGTHSASTGVYGVELAATPTPISRIVLEESAEARAALIQYYRRTRRSIGARVIGRLRRQLRRRSDWH